MAQQILAGQYRVELDGNAFVVRDRLGLVVETVDATHGTGKVQLPDGTLVDTATLADALVDPKVADMETGAGTSSTPEGEGPTPAANEDTQPLTDGGIHFTRFHANTDLQGLTAVGRLDDTSLTYGGPDFPTSSIEPNDAPTQFVAHGGSGGDLRTYAPIAEVLALDANEDQSITSAVHATDRDGDTLSFSLVTGPAHGSLHFDADGTFTYRPDPDYNGADTFTYRANDGSHDSNVATVSISVTPINDAPVAGDGAFKIAEDASLAASVKATDLDSSTLTYTIVDAPQHGTIQFNSDGTFIYTPNADYDGPDAFTYRANDGSLDSNIASVAITVAPVNDAPVAADAALVLNEDTAFIGQAAAKDIDGGTLSYTVEHGPQHGTLQFAADGSYTYTPDANYNGADSFTFHANDGSLDSNVATVNLTVAPANDAPVAADAALVLNEDTAFFGSAQATDIDGDALSYAVVTGPQHGTLQFASDGSYTYTPNANYNGTDSFTFKASDGSLSSNTAKIDLSVAAVNDAPTANNGAAATNEDIAVSGQAVATDIDSPNLTYQLVTGPQHGTLQFASDGSYTYTPNANYNGTDSFTFKASDGSLSSNTAKIDLAVAAVNDAPTANNGAAATNEDVVVSGQAVATDIDSPNLTYQLVTGPQHGTLQFASDGSFKYLPDANYNGADSFTYRANDGSLNSNLAKVDITVKPVNDAPVVTAGDVHTDVHTVAINTAQSLNGTYAIGDYLASAGKESSAIDAKLVNGVDTSSLTLAQSVDVKVGFLSEGAGYRSMLGTYTFDAKGNIDPTSLKLVWLDGTAVQENVSGAALVKDFLGNTQPSTVSLGQMAAGSQVGFFLIADGASSSANKTLIGNVAGVNKTTDNYQSDIAAINQKLGFQVDANGNGHVTVNGQALAGQTYFTHNSVLNTDANNNDMLHAISGISSKNDGKLYIGFEDLAGGGDKDYNDMIITVDIGSYNINKLTQGFAQPTVHITDIDSTTLADATITTTGFHAGDHLNLPSSNLFDVTVTNSGNDTSIHVVAKSGAESLGAFDSFLNGVYFSSTSTEEGSRTLHYSVTDSSGAHSNIGDAHVELTTSYDISASQLAGRTQLGAGDDTLHLNQAMTTNLDAGSGYDTVKLEQTNLSFGHNEAAKLHNIEAIDTTGFGKNAVTLSADDVLNMADSNHHLTVVGNTGDSLSLVGDGTHHWHVTGADASFTTVAFDDGVHQAVIVVSNELSLTVS